ncbi:hypothetical protein CPHO_11960 [Corynebacterium phocae]|uniref:ABC3 transporter permease C-terminal domain-containing protein n=1 Tax=Corynebacterium phocae TaxID=161895 RepID=A0A1L7D5P1_9CORY|nr:ABC transporter permease [Corynebacterium phocae]APT93486.1 hypothetical protein CPHO_11960 [Corynebacterium phocae]KAA8720566.1 ABC transporter permease [Corynebacterium phocae]
MFLSMKEIAAAKARVALMSGVVAMITLLLIMLSGLTGGLGKQNTQALESLDAPGFVFADNQDPSFSTSQVTGPGALGIAQTRVGGDAAALFALAPGYASPVGKIPAEGLIASESLGFAPGDVVEFAGQPVEIVAVSPDSYYSHIPVVWGPTSLWRQAMHSDEDGTVLLADTPDALTTTEAFAALPAYKSERGSLLTMQALLYAISALVTVAFLSVWTIQRTRDLSILRALGASSRYLLKDAMSQSAFLVGIGVLAGTVAGVGLGWLASRAVPFQQDLVTVAGPALGVWVLGMLGAFLATRRVTKTNPLLALGGNA